MNVKVLLVFAATIAVAAAVNTYSGPADSFQANTPGVNRCVLLAITG